VYIFLVIIICWLPFFFLKSGRFFFLSYFISYFILRKFYFPLSFYFSMRWRPSQCRERLKWFFFKKLRLRPWPHQASLKINLARSNVSAWMYKCVQYFSFLIFLIFFVWYWHLGRDAWVYWKRTNVYTKSYDDLWECMYEMRSFHLC